MSGGYVDEDRREYGHQVMIFTFIGKIRGDDRIFWNDAISGLKKHFGTRLTGVTLWGEETPKQYRSETDRASRKTRSKTRKRKRARRAR